MKWFKKDKENVVLVRICIGCVLPYNCKLIGSGTYPYFGPKGKVMEQYYDYEIKETDLVDFLETNSTLLLKYQLLDVEKEEKVEDKNPLKPTTVRGWSKKED
jgi:hypothetical protein